MVFSTDTRTGRIWLLKIEYTTGGMESNASEGRAVRTWQWWLTSTESRSSPSTTGANRSSMRLSPWSWSSRGVSKSSVHGGIKVHLPQRAVYKNMSLKNYESKSPLPNIFAAIEKTLATHGAKQVTRDYDDQGKIVSISFIISTKQGVLGIKLPARFDRVERIFQDIRTLRLSKIEASCSLNQNLWKGRWFKVLLPERAVYELWNSYQINNHCLNAPTTRIDRWERYTANSKRNGMGNIKGRLWKSM